MPVVKRAAGASPRLRAGLGLFVPKFLLQAGTAIGDAVQLCRRFACYELREDRRSRLKGVCHAAQV
jgi:hypothetical protein